MRKNLDKISNNYDNTIKTINNVNLSRRASSTSNYPVVLDPRKKIVEQYSLNTVKTFHLDVQRLSFKIKNRKNSFSKLENEIDNELNCIKNQQSPRRNPKLNDEQKDSLNVSCSSLLSSQSEHQQHDNQSRNSSIHKITNISNNSSTIKINEQIDTNSEKLQNENINISNGGNNNAKKDQNILDMNKILVCFSQIRQKKTKFTKIIFLESKYYFEIKKANELYQKT
jgi:hypothetical protein